MKYQPRHPLPFVLALLFAAATPVSAQQQPGANADQDFARHLFPPELVMQHQQRIGLRDDQRKAITDAITQLQTRVVELQWQMQAETQKLSTLVQETTVREPETLAQVDRVFAIEREVKRAHLTALIRIKNILTREQQATLNSLR